ncbi:RF-1 domain-containing protein [Daldinia grandis]|nr:RF-1 domain-containing protein [Daldinia grandis]
MPSLLPRLQPLRNYLPSIARRSHIYSTTTRTTRITSRPSSFSASPPLFKNTNLPPRPKPPPEGDIQESFLRGSGPGGQKINKTSSAVQLKHLPTGLVVKSQATRSRSQNRVIARQLLADKLDKLTRGDESRSAVVGAFKSKKKASSAKKSRRKYRKLDEDKQQAQAGTALQGEEALGEEEFEEFEEDGEEEEFQDSLKNSERIEK